MIHYTPEDPLILTTTNDIRHFARAGEAADLELEYIIRNEDSEPALAQNIHLAVGCSVRVTRNASVLPGSPDEPSATIVIAEFTMSDGSITTGLFHGDSETFVEELGSQAEVDEWVQNQVDGLSESR